MEFGVLKLCNKYFLTSYKLNCCDVNTLPALCNMLTLGQSPGLYVKRKIYQFITMFSECH